MSSPRHAAPTTLTTTATLRKACAASTAHHPEPMCAKASGPSKTARNATPTTTVGKTNGTVTTTFSIIADAPRSLDDNQTMGAATRSASAVDAAAWASVTPSR